MYIQMWLDDIHQDCQFYGILATGVACKQETLTVLGHMVSARNSCFVVRFFFNEMFIMYFSDFY